MKQWHPIFAELLRLLLGRYYDLQTNVAVGDRPREADFVLLRRTSKAVPPFRRLWRYLTIWSILEFKGPSVSPRGRDLELLIELGLGIDRHLREEQTGRRPPAPEEVSFWYIANHLGSRFLADAERKLGQVAPLGPGLWRGQVLRHLVFLVSGIDLPVEEESLPLHVVGKEPATTEREVARFVAEQPRLQELYGGWMLSLHPASWEEVEEMARSRGRELKIDLRPAIRILGLGEVLRQAGLTPKRLIQEVGAKRLIQEVGAKRLIQEVGAKRLIEEMGPERFLDEVGLDWLLSHLPAKKRRDLLRRWQ